MKKFFTVAVLGAALIFGGNAEAYDKFIGTSEATGWDCYVLTETIERVNDSTNVTLKMVKPNNEVSYLDYSFWYDSSGDVMRFSNEQGYSGIVNRYETPIEWEMLQVIRNY